MMAKLKFFFLFVAILIYIQSASTKMVALQETLSKAICKQMTSFKASTTIQPALQDKDDSLEGCGWVHWKQCTEGKDCSSFSHKPQQNCPPEGEAGAGSVPSSPPSPPPSGVGGSGTGSAPPNPPPPPPSGGGGSSGTVKAGRIHISRSLSQSICTHMKEFQTSKTLQDPLNDKDKFAPGDQECSWLHWQKCEPRGSCDNFVQKACNEVKVPSSPPSPPPSGAGGSGTGSAPPNPPPPSGGGGSSGTVKAGRIHISRSLSQSICTHMKGFQSSKKLQEPLNDKDKFASGDQECSWLHWQKCEPRGTCENFVQKACNDVKVPSG